MLYKPFVIFIDLFSQQSLSTIAKHLLKISYRTLKCLDRGDNLRPQDRGYMIVIKSRLTAFTDIRIYCLIHIIYPSRDPSRVNASEAFLFPAFLLPLRNLPTSHVSGHVQVPKERPRLPYFHLAKSILRYVF